MPTTKIEITVTPRKGDKKRKTSKPKGPVKPLRRRDDLGRRRITGGRINFYDLGYLKNLNTGLFQDIGFVHLDESHNVLDAIPQLTNVEVQVNRDSLIFAVPNDSWTTRFKRILPADVGYKAELANDTTNLLLNQTNPEFTADGLNLPGGFLESSNVRFESSEVTSVAGDMPFYSIKFKGFERNRVTATYDMNAADTGPVGLSGKTDIFLMPRVCFAFIQGQVGNISPAPARFYLMNRFFMTPPRAKYLDPSHPLYGEVIINNSFDSSGETGDPTLDLAIYNSFLRYLNYQKSFFGARMFFRSSAGSPVWAPSSLSDLPQPEMVPPGIGLAIAFMIYNLVGAIGNTNVFYEFPDKMLIAVVVKGASRYYIWSDTV